MSRGARHVHYDDDLCSKKYKGSHHRRQRRRRRVGRRAKIYGAAFLLALTGFFCLVPGTSLTVVAFTNGTNSKESILRLLGPVFGGVGVILIGISIGLVCYAVLYKRKSRNGKERHSNADGNGSVTKDGAMTAEVRLLDADAEDTGAIKVKHTLVPNQPTHKGGRQGMSLPLDGTGVPSTSKVIVDIIHPPPAVTVSMAGQGQSESADVGALQASKESFQTGEDTKVDSPCVADAASTADTKQCGTTLVEV